MIKNIMTVLNEVCSSLPRIFFCIKLQFLSTSLVLTPPWNISLVSVSKEGWLESKGMSLN